MDMSFMSKQQVQQLQREQFGVKGKTSGELLLVVHIPERTMAVKGLWLDRLMGG